jgi:hypothetical protein
MTISIRRVTSTPGKGERKPWTAPAIVGVKINAAEGPHKGTKSDKHGSASGTGA